MVIIQEATLDLKIVVTTLVIKPETTQEQILVHLVQVVQDQTILHHLIHQDLALVV